jgi:DNA-binding winged helix-turn-helix (wHTH) protein/Tfp pilus assembly protein PilF
MGATTDGQAHNRVIELARQRPFRLGRVEVRPATRELIGPLGRAVIEPRVMQVLVALARAGGEILTRDDLTESCWAGRIVGEDALSRVISKLRRASEGVGRDGWRLETVTKVGYRILPPDYDPEAPLVAPSMGPAWRRRALLTAGGVAAAALVSGGGFGLWRTLRRPKMSDKALALYQQGREAMRAGLPESNAQAQGFLREAVAQAPESAEAWGALATAYQASLQYTPPQRQAGVFAQAQAAARRALDLDPNDAQALAALALLQPSYRNWGAAEAAYNRALAHHAGDADIEFIYARLLLEVGRIKACVVRAQASVAGDDFAIWHHQILGLGLWAAGRIEEADAVVAKALARWPRHYVFWFLQQDILIYSGRADRAVALGDDLASRPINFPPTEIEAHLMKARALQSGAAADLRAAAEAVLAAARHGVGYAENAIGFLSTVGRLDDAFAVARALYFDEGFAMPQQRFSTSTRFDVAKRRKTHILFLPSARALRADPRFGLLVRDLGIAAYWATRGHAPDDPSWAHGFA